MTAVADEIQIDEAPFRGSVVRPDHPDYDTHRKIWNGSFDKHPALIIRCAGVSDVIAAVKFGRESGLPSTGTSTAASTWAAAPLPTCHPPARAS